MLPTYDFTKKHNVLTSNQKHAKRDVSKLVANKDAFNRILQYNVCCMNDKGCVIFMILILISYRIVSYRAICSIVDGLHAIPQ
jgi:hypothetical protein